MNWCLFTSASQDQVGRLKAEAFETELKMKKKADDELRQKDKEHQAFLQQLFQLQCDFVPGGAPGRKGALCKGALQAAKQAHGRAVGHRDEKAEG